MSWVNHELDYREITYELNLLLSVNGNVCVLITFLYIDLKNVTLIRGEIGYSGI